MTGGRPVGPTAVGTDDPSRVGECLALPSHAEADGWLSALAPVVYLPFEDSLLQRIDVSVAPAGPGRVGSHTAPHADSGALGLSVAAADLLHARFLGRLPVGVAAVLKWRALADLLDAAATGTAASSPLPVLTLGDAGSVLLTNPLPLLSTLPEVRSL